MRQYATIQGHVQQSRQFTVNAASLLEQPQFFTKGRHLSAGIPQAARPLLMSIEFFAGIQTVIAPHKTVPLSTEKQSGQNSLASEKWNAVGHELVSKSSHNASRPVDQDMCFPSSGTLFRYQAR